MTINKETIIDKINKNMLVLFEGHSLQLLLS